MRSATLGCLLALVVSWSAWAVDESAMTPQQQFDALVKAHRDAETAFSQAYQAAKTPEEKQQVSKDHPNASAQAHAAGFAKLVEKYPNDPVALKAVEWIMQSAPSGPAADHATSALGKELVKSREVLGLCRTLRRRADENSETLLQRIIDNNPHRDVQGQARYAQCLNLKTSFDEEPPSDEVARLGKELEAQLVELSEKYGDIKDLDRTLKESAASLLFEIRFLSIGSRPPDIVGEDLSGKPLKLSEFRGRVVMLVFWGTWCGPCMASVPEHLTILRKHEGKPLAIVGVNSDEDRTVAAAVAAEKGITWRSWSDKSTRGPIATQWNVHSWPTIYLLDANGTIRYKGDMLRAVSVRRKADGQFEQFTFLEDYVDQLVKETASEN